MLYFKFYISSLLLIIFINTNSLSQNNKRDRLTISEEIIFLEKEPVIDGLLDKDLKNTAFRKYESKFNIHFLKGSLNSQYKIFYGTKFLYLYLEAEADSFICKDRGYQNGDGFIISLTKPNKTSKVTDEFYVLGFSAQYEAKQKWAEKVLWYYNNEVILKKLDDEVKIKYAATSGKISFELLLPWNKVYPYHPWLSDQIGINLWFVKAFPEKSFPNMQGIMFDMGIMSEQKLPKYKLLNFEKPKINNTAQVYAGLNKNNCKKGENIQLNIVAISSSVSTEDNSILIYNNKKTLLSKIDLKLNYSEGLNKVNQNINTNELPSGDYKIKLLTNDIVIAKTDLTIMPEYDYTNLSERLKNLSGEINEGSYNTLSFYIDDIKKRENDVYEYETCSNLRKDMQQLNSYFEKTESGQDVIQKKTGQFRRAFLSKTDTTLQPYTVYVPDDYQPSKKYPLMVFLHGSGRDDQNMFTYHEYLIRSDIILIAPRARGRSHYYGTQLSQIDIQEALSDVLKVYSIDTSNIILSGFSMGGYGVYRTYYENPGKYKALAVFSGLPKVNRFFKTKKGKYYNFLKEEKLNSFKDIPIFIYHGKKDVNCPYKLTIELVEKLKKSGANIKFSVAETGHSVSKNKQNLDEYYSWLNNLLIK